MSVKNAWMVVKRALKDTYAANVFKLSASLAYFTVFSMPGLLIIIIWVSEFFYGQQVVTGAVYSQLEGYVGRDAALSIQQTVSNAMQTTNSQVATIIGLASLVIGATSVFSEIQDSINLIWKLKAKPRK